MRVLRGILRVIDNISEVTGRILALAMPVLVVVVMYEIISRSVFNSPTKWVNETSLFLFGGAALMAGAYTHRHRAHVVLDILVSRLSVRKRAIVDIINSGFFWFFCGFMLYWGWKFAAKAWKFHEMSWSYWGPPIYPIKTLLPIAAALILLQGLANLTRDIITAITGKKELTGVQDSMIGREEIVAQKDAV